MIQNLMSGHTPPHEPASLRLQSSCSQQQNSCHRGFNGTERLRSVETLDKLDPNATWIPISELITQRSNFGATVVNKQIMVTGGLDGQQVISDTEFYFEETNQWTRSQPMEVKQSALSLVTVKGLPNRKNYLAHHH